MKHISILPLYDSTMSSIDSAYQIFSRVNDFMRYQGKSRAYEIEIAGLEKNTRLNDGMYGVYADKTIYELEKTDVIVILLLCGDFETAILKNKDYVDWVKMQHGNNAEIVCLCVGSFFLASTGLLNGRKCAVHWAAKNDFKALFPDVTIADDAIITDEQGIYTCGGGFSYLNLILYIIEKHLGREISVLASKMFEIDIERKSQNPFAIFIGQKKHGNEVVLKAQNYIENNPAAVISVDDLCEELSVSRRTLERHFKKCTGNSIKEYIQRVKVELAKQQLETGRKTVSEIIYETGYTDIDAFRKVFKKFTDLSPADYRKRFASQD